MRPRSSEVAEDAGARSGVAAETALSLRAAVAGRRRPGARAGGGRGWRAARGGGERFARAALAGQAARASRGASCWRRSGAAGEAIRAELEGRAAAELELYPRKERKRVETEWSERIRRVRRRVETSALDLALQLVALWFADLAYLAWGAEELVRNVDRGQELREDAADADPQRLRAAIELVEETRQRFQLNVTEELACEALAYRLERALAP